MTNPAELLQAAKDQAEAAGHPAAQLLRDAGPTVAPAVVAEVYGVTKAHILNLIRRGEFPLPVIRLGNRVRIPTVELLRSLGLDSDPDPTARPDSKPAA